MQQIEAHIQQFIEAGQLELAYQLLLSLDQSEPVQAFMDIVGRSLPNNQEIHRLCQNRHLFTQDLYAWESRFKIIADMRYFWDADRKNSIYLSIFLFEDLEDPEYFKPQMDEFHIYHPDDTVFLLQQIYEMIELNAPKILAHSA